MVLDQDTDERDAAVRAMLVEHARRSVDGPPSLARALAGTDAGRPRLRFSTALAAVVVLALVVVASALAIRLGGERGAPAHGGLPPTQSSLDPVPTPSGVLLGRYSSADGPNQTHTIHPNGLALSYRFRCTGPGPYSISISHDSGESGDRSCSDSGGYGNKGHRDPLTVTIRTARTARWTFVVMGIPETYVTPRPVLKPTDATGAAVRFCTADDLAVQYEPVRPPAEVTRVRVGQLVLTNTSDSTCALAGHPGVRFLDGDTPLGHHTMERTDQRSSEEHGLVPVLVKPRDKAYAQIDWYLPNYYVPNEQGPCQAKAVHALRVDLANRLAGAAQTGSFDVPIRTATACLNGPWGVDGKYGQVSSSVFVGYAADPGR